MFSKNHDRLIEHDAVTEMFNATVEIANGPGLLSGEHFSVNGTLIQAWASHKSLRRKDATGDGRPREDWRGEPRSNDTHESKSDPASLLYRKSNAPPALPSNLGPVLTDNRHGPVVNVQASATRSTAARNVAAQIRHDVEGPGKRVTVGVDKSDDTKGFVKACCEINVTPHVSQNVNRHGGCAIAGGTTKQPGYRVSRRKRKRIKHCFGCGKVDGPTR